MPKAPLIEAMFARIARRYDLANRLLSLGMDVHWRKRLRHAVTACNPHVVTDLACGSGDVTLALAKALPPPLSLCGLDFCEPMLAEARRKQASRQLPNPITFIQGDCLALPFTTASQDVLTIAFGLRNLEDRAKGLAEMCRVLRPGGTLFVLEFTQPSPWFKPIYRLYLHHLLPPLAKLLTSDREAYRYLAGSIEGFPTREALSAELNAAGFTKIKHTAMTFGIVALHQAQIPSLPSLI